MKIMFKSLAFSLLLLISSKCLADAPAPKAMPAEVTANTKSADSNVIEVLGKDKFNEVVLQSSKPVVVKFGAPWCPACVRSKAPYHKLSNDPELAHVTFVDMDFDKNSATAQQYDVQSLPTFLYFNNGKLAATKTGFSENLKNEIANTVANMGAAPAPQVDSKKNEEAAAAPTAQEEVSGPACAAATEGSILQSINNFFSSLWNTLTGWFK